MPDASREGARSARKRRKNISASVRGQNYLREPASWILNSINFRVDERGMKKHRLLPRYAVAWLRPLHDRHRNRFSARLACRSRWLLANALPFLPTSTPERAS